MKDVLESKILKIQDFCLGNLQNNVRRCAVLKQNLATVPKSGWLDTLVLNCHLVSLLSLWNLFEKHFYTIP